MPALRSLLSLALVVAMVVVPSRLAAPFADDLQAGIKQIDNGDFQAAIVTLQALVTKLTPEGTARSRELSQAHLYMGVAFVGLAQEERAKESFREALRHDPALRVVKGQFPDRVVRVFEAARKGKTGSVLERPSDAPKKAGLGAAGIALIVVGGVALAGGAAAVATRSTAPVPTTVPTPTVSGRWEGTYTWDCEGGRRGSTPIIFELAESGGRITGGTATYLGAVSNVIGGFFRPVTLEVSISVGPSANAVGNTFTGRLEGTTITGTTLNGDSPVPGDRGCSAATPPSGTFTVRRP